MNRRQFFLALSSAPLLAQTASRAPELEWVDAKKLTGYAEVPNELLAPNQGMSYGGADTAESMNFGGNLEVIPPHTAPNGKVYPFGRMYYGASLDQSAAVVPRPPMPPPTTLVRQQVGLPVDKRDMLPAETKLSGDAIAVLEAWVKKQAK